jgi:drug/metabolite transporter (DMT)-like permease
VYYVVIIPAVCDFTATFMMNVGLLFISASVWQMIRGSIVVFSVLIRMVWLKKKIRNFEWFGVMIIMVALAIVGLSSVLGGSMKKASVVHRVTGILLVFVAQGVQALQTVVEEHLLHNIQASSRQIVGLEGFWGFVLCACVAMPIAAYLPGSDGNGLHEDTMDSFAMLSHSNELVVFTLIFVFVILGFNICGMRMTKFTNSVSRNVMEAVRTMCIWGTSLFIHYVISPSYGEPWDDWSWMQLGGFVVLVFGLFIYYEVLHLSWFNYEEEIDPVKAEEEQKKHWAMTPAPGKTAASIPGDNPYVA